MYTMKVDTRTKCARLMLANTRLTDLVACCEKQILEMRKVARALAPIAGTWPRCADMRSWIHDLAPFLVDLDPMLESMSWWHYPEHLTWSSEDPVLPHHPEHDLFEDLIVADPKWLSVRTWADEAMMQTVYTRDLGTWQAMENSMRCMRPRLFGLKTVQRMLFEKLEYWDLVEFLDDRGYNDAEDFLHSVIHQDDF